MRRIRQPPIHSDWSADEAATTDTSYEADNAAEEAAYSAYEAETYETEAADAS
jgi:hypothetical protein